MNGGEQYADCSDEALFQRAVQAEANDESHDCVAALHGRGTRDVFDLAMAYCASRVGMERRIGAVVLAQLGYREGYPYHEASIPVLISMLSDSDPDALVGAANAFGFVDAPGSISGLVRLADHHDPAVRDAVVRGLHAQVSSDFPAEAVDALIRLSGDRQDRDVRDWATFTLRSVAAEGIDAPEIRAAMWARMEDEDAEVRAEALEGLATYGDRKVIPTLQAEIRRGCEQDWAYVNVLRAAETLADAELLPALHELRSCVHGWLEEDDRDGSTWLADIDRDSRLFGQCG